MTQRVRAAVLAITCFALGAVAQRFYDARRPAAPQPPQAVNAPGTDVRIAEDKAAAARQAIPFDREPLWAYGFDTPAKPGDKAAPQAPPSRNLRPNQDPGEQTRPRHLEGSSATYSLVDIRDGQNVIDWFPGDHPPMPSIIAHGPARMGNRTRGCGSCHLPNGKGRPENAAPAALPVTYVMRQIDDFRNGLRYTADPRKPNTNTMIELAKAMTDEEVRTAAEYFASMKWTPWIRVVETNLVPKTRIAGNLFLATEEARTEPIAGRIIEVPENEEQAETLPQSALRVRRLRAGRQHQEGEGSRDHGRHEDRRQQDRPGQDHGLRHLPRAWISWAWPTCRRSPAARRATWSGRCGTCSRGRGTARPRS